MKSLLNIITKKKHKSFFIESDLSKVKYKTVF